MGIYIGIGNYIGKRGISLKPTSVVVRILDEGTNEPLIGAVVIFKGQEYITNASGQVILSGLVNSTYHLEVRRKGHETTVIDKWVFKEGDILLTDITRNIIAEIGVNILTEDGNLIIRDDFE